MSELPVWVLMSFAFGFGGMFVLGCVVVLWLLECLPSVQRYLDRLLGGDDASQ